MSRAVCSTYGLVQAWNRAGNKTLKECRAACLTAAVKALAPFSPIALDITGFGRVSQDECMCVALALGSDLKPTVEEFHMDCIPQDYAKLI
jgi:hypothetical protein